VVTFALNADSGLPDGRFSVCPDAAEIRKSGRGGVLQMPVYKQFVEKLGVVSEFNFIISTTGQAFVI